MQSSVDKFDRLTLSLKALDSPQQRETFVVTGICCGIDTVQVCCLLSYDYIIMYTLPRSPQKAGNIMAYSYLLCLCTCEAFTSKMSQ
jgi:hypothetical protein